MIILNFQLTKEDYFNFYYHSAYLAPGKRSKLIKERVKGFLVLGILLFLIKLSSPTQTFDTFFFTSMLIIGAIYLIPLFTVGHEMRKQAYRFLENPMNANVLTPTEVIVSETGISSKDKFCDVTYKWDSIVKKEENAAYYFLYLNSIQAIIIPKKSLRTEEEREKLAKLLAQNISFNAEVGHLTKD